MARYPPPPLRARSLVLAETFTCPFCKRVLTAFSGKDIGITTAIVEGVTKAVVICKACYEGEERQTLH